MKKRSLFIIAALVLLSVMALSCERKDEKRTAEGKLTVVTTLFPLYDFSRNIGGGNAEVLLLLPPGVEPHHFEPRPGDIARIQKADLFVYAGSFMEPWAEKILSGMDRSRLTVVDASAGVKLLELGGGHEHHGGERAGKGSAATVDPHIWLDFANAAMMVDNIAAGFILRDPRERDSFSTRAAAYKARLQELDRRYRESLSRCREKLIVHAGHFTFGYLAKRYGLRYVSAYPGVTPDTEPTPRRLLAITDRVRQAGVKVVFYEELLTPRVAEAIGKETGARLLMLHGGHNVTKEEMERGVTFLSLMEKNLDHLKIGLECP